MTTDTPRKAWVVHVAVHREDLEKLLNELEQDSYQVFKLHGYAQGVYDVIACDPSLIGRRQGEAIAKSMGLLRDAVAASVAAGQAGLPPGVAL